MRRTFLIALVVLLPLIALQFSPLTFHQDQHELQRIGWPFWYDRQFHVVFPGVPAVMWNSLWHGANVKAIVGNALVAAYTFVCLVAIGVQSTGFRRLLLIDVTALTIAVALCVNFRLKISAWVRQCESALGSSQETPSSLLQSSLLQVLSVTMCFGTYAMIRMGLRWKRTDNILRIR